MLRQEFESRMKANPLYSLRAFARDIGLSPATVSLVFHQKKGLSPKKAKALCEKLGWNRSETSLFLKSIIASHSRSPETLQEAQMQLQNMRQKNLLDAKTLSSLRSWYSLALLELMELPSCQHTPEWFAKKLKLNTAMIKFSLQNLIDNGLVEFKNKRYAPLHDESTTEFDIPSDSIKSFHAQLLRRAEESLQAQSTTSREFLAMTLAFSEENMPAAKEMIRQFQESFAEKFYTKNKRIKNSVYTLNIQLFRLDDGSSL